MSEPVRIAYLISAYKDAPHLLRLTEALEGDGVDFYVHVDRKVDARPFHDLLDGKAVFVHRYWVNWGSWAQVEYQRELLGAAITSGRAYDRVVCLSGQDYPLWSRERIRQHFREHPLTEFIMGQNLTQAPNRSQQIRIRWYHFFRDLRWHSAWWRNKVIVASRLLMRLLPIRKPPTAPLLGQQVEVFCGSDYWSLTMDCARHVLHVLTHDRALVRYFRHSFVPSEMCVQTIVFNSSFRQNVLPHSGQWGLYHHSPLHYLDYGKSIKVLTLADYAAIRLVDRMFCRKVVTGYSDSLVREIHERNALQSPGPVPAGHDTLSIVLCTYNGARNLRPLLDSLLAQTRPADEIIVQDDCSTDDTCAIVQEYAQQHRSIRLYRNAKRMGINANFFSALRRVSGDYIALCEQDDIWLPHKLERQMQAIGTRLLCAGQSLSFVSDQPEQPEQLIETDLHAPNYDLLRLIFLATFTGQTVLMRRTLLRLLPDVEAIATVRMYDVILAMVAAAYDSLASVDDILVHHRYFPDTATNTASTIRSRSLGNIARNLLHALRLHHELRPQIAHYMAITHNFLCSIPSPEPALARALHLTELQSRTGLRYVLAFPRLQAFCIRHCNRLFHARTAWSLILSLRAAYFPISCSKYFRNLNRKEKGRNSLRTT